jgi:hypothetical protein
LIHFFSFSYSKTILLDSYLVTVSF